LPDRDRQAWRVLVEELEAIPPPERQGGGQRARHAAGKGSFAEFRKIAPDIASLPARSIA